MEYANVRFTCCDNTAMTSASNSVGLDVMRNPRKRRTSGANMSSLRAKR